MTNTNLTTNQDNKVYRYFAFISYSSKDKKFAEKLQKQIETYRLPTVLRKELEQTSGKKYPERVKPLFRDMTDLNAGVLGKSILRELEDSRYLLVICTPNSAQSAWVNQEIENYILMGRYEHIILYIVDGEPNSTDPSKECFPPILRKNREYLTYSDMTPEQNAERQAKLHALLDGVGELKGLSIQGEGPKVARLKAIAKMLEVEPDVLIQRDKQRQKQAFHRNMTIVLSLLLCVIVSCLYVWDRYYRIHVGYYADYVEKWGVPEGIIPLTKDQIANRYDHYRIYTQNQLVQRLEHVNSAGTPIPVNNTEFRDRPMIAVYSIYKDGRLIQRDTLDNNSKVVMSYRYSDNQMQKVEFKGQNNDETTDTLLLGNLTSINSTLGISKQKTSVGGMFLKRDEQGRVIEVRFLKEGYNIPITDEQGVAGFRYKLDDLGRIIEKIYLNLDGQPQPNKRGVARRTNRYDDNGNLIETKYYDQNSKLTCNEQDWMWRIDTFDNNGNITVEKFLDANGKLCLDNNDVAGWTLKYDERWNVINVAYFGIDGKPCLSQEKFAKVTKKYDECGNIIEEAYFDMDGKACLNNNGVASCTTKYDERGNIIEQAYFGMDGKPCLSQEKFAKITQKYDERGNIIEEAYFGMDGKPCLSQERIAKFTLKYDERGNLIEQTNFGIDDQPCLHKNGFASWTKKYDERGNCIEQAYFGMDGKPYLHNIGIAKVTLKYDERGNIIEQAYFGMDGKPCLIKDGIAKFTQKYDERGNIIEEAYFDIDDKPCLHNIGVAKFTLKYDERGNRIEDAYFGFDGKPCLHKDGNAKVTYKYDERGNIIEQAYFGMDGKPCLRKNNVAKVTQKYNEYGNIINEAYFGMNGKPCLSQEGIAKFTKKYDERENEIEVACFGMDGKPCVSKYGYAKIAKKYDEHGNVIEIANFGIDDKPCLDKDGISSWTRRYDERGNIIEEAYFGMDGKPCLHNVGIAKFTKKYDENGNKIKEAYFGIDGKPCILEENNPYTSWERIYHENGMVTKQIAYYSSKPSPTGILGKIVTQYDEHGNVIEISNFDSNDKPCLDNSGVAKITPKYKLDKLSEIAYFGIDGKPCLNKSGYAKIVIQQLLGNSSPKRYFDLAGKDITNQGRPIITLVLPESQGQSIGLQKKDIIIEYDGKVFSTDTAFIEYRNQESGDNPRTLWVLRSGVVLKFQVVPGKLGCVMESQYLPEDTLKSATEKLEKLKTQDMESVPQTNKTSESPKE